MPDLSIFRSAFDLLATDECIGDPGGIPAYAYIRVSDDYQAEEGRSGLPRQIAHVHEAAAKHGYKIAWDCVYADDYTGFVFEERPALSRLRRAYKSPSRNVHAVIMEHIDRLSRNADWHQGYLLEEMHCHDLKTIFWREYGSRLERTVLGAVAQEGMEQAKQRMMQGNLHKARSGRVTARVPAYGYKLVDENGEEGATARKDTYYAIRDDEATVIRLLFERVAQGDALRKICSDFTDTGFDPPKKYRYWEPTQLRLFIRNEVYKGDFYAHRWNHTKVQKLARDGITMKTVYRKVQRPREEWIHVPVPAIVTVEQWEAANRMLKQNKRTARRNAKIPFLLTGLLKCARCGYSYSGTSKYKGKGGKPRKNPYRGYRCSRSNGRPKHVILGETCDNPNIKCDLLDTAVWEVVCHALLQPATLIDALESGASSERNRQLESQIAYLETTIDRRHGDDEKLLRAYMAGAFDEHEYATQRKMVKTELLTLQKEVERLREQVVTPEQLATRKAEVLAMSEAINAQNIPIEPPFELKQRIIKMLVDKVTVDVGEGWFTLEGAIRSVLPIENIPVGRDFARRLAGNWRGRSHYLWHG